MRSNAPLSSTADRPNCARTFHVKPSSREDAPGPHHPRSRAQCSAQFATAQWCLLLPCKVRRSVHVCKARRSVRQRRLCAPAHGVLQRPEAAMHMTRTQRLCPPWLPGQSSASAGHPHPSAAPRDGPVGRHIDVPVSAVLTYRPSPRPPSRSIHAPSGPMTLRAISRTASSTSSSTCPMSTSRLRAPVTTIGAGRATQVRPIPSHAVIPG